MSKERMMILEMLADGKINADDAQVLFRALGEDEPGEIDGVQTKKATQTPETAAPTGLQNEMNQQDGNQSPPAVVDRPSPTPAAHNMISAIARMLTKPSSSAAHDRRRRYPDPSFAVAMKRAEMDFSIDQLFRLQEEDIDPEMAAKMVRERRPEWTSDDIVDMLVKGACPDVLEKLNELGFDNLSPHDLIQLTENDVELEYLERFKGMPTTGLTAHDLIEFYNNDVNPELASTLKEFGPVTTSAIVKAAEYDLSPEFVRQIAEEIPGITVRQLIELCDNDVSADFIQALVRGGFTNLTIKQIIHLYENDVDPKDAAWFRGKLGEQFTPDDLLRLINNDIDRDYLKSLLKFNLPDLNADTLIELANHDVSAEDVARARKAYGDNLSVADLINIADHS